MPMTFTRTLRIFAFVLLGIIFLASLSRGPAPTVTPKTESAIDECERKYPRSPASVTECVARYWSEKIGR